MEFDKDMQLTDLKIIENTNRAGGIALSIRKSGDIAFRSKFHEKNIKQYNFCTVAIDKNDKEKMFLYIIFTNKEDGTTRKIFFNNGMYLSRCAELVNHFDIKGKPLLFCFDSEKYYNDGTIHKFKRITGAQQ